MKNKLVKLLLCIVMVSAILVGCNSNNTESSDESKSDSNVKAEVVEKLKYL